MVPALGQSALVATIVISCISILGIFVLSRHHRNLSVYGGRASLFFVFVLLALSFGSLVWSYVFSDLSVMSVAMNSHQETPLLYKITGTWGSHEGSMLLWLLILSGFGIACLFSFRSQDTPVVVPIFFLFLIGYLAAFIYLTSNPFIKVRIPFLQGRDLNPILQDPALALHPPFLYLGYAGFVVPFVLAISGSRDLKILRRWSLLPWSFLTLGIGLGSYWAYYELGWGGWWFWDPVENVSLMPWLFGTALLHSVQLSIKRNYLLKTTKVLAIGSFLLSVLGTFLVRAGILSSFHSFAADPERGFWIALLLGILSIFGFLSFIQSMRKEKEGVVAPFLSREWVMMVGIGVFILLTFTVMLGTLYPLLLEKAGGPSITVGAPYFSSTFIPVALGVLLLVPVTSFIRWGKRMTFSQLKGLLPGLTGVCAALLLATFFEVKAPFRFWVGLGVSVWILVGTLSSFFEKAPQNRKITPRMLAHGGLGLMMLGMTIDSFLVEEKSLILKEGEPQTFRDMHVTLEKMTQEKKPTYLQQIATLKMEKKGAVYSLYPEKRFYPGHEVLTTEVSLKHFWFSDLYVALGGHYPPDRWGVRLSYHPCINLIWFGILLMSLGGIASFFKRKKRRIHNSSVN